MEKNNLSRKLVVFVLFAFIVGLSGCGKPPKDVVRKMALNYLKSDGLILDDIKYLSAYSKDGGYTVNIQAGDALCEMPMIKGEKDWIAKGISCSGQFLSHEEIAKRKKALFSEELKKEVAGANAKGPQTLENGVRIEKATFDGSRLSWLMTSPLNAVEFTEEAKKTIMTELIAKLCTLPSTRNAFEAGFSYGYDINSVDGKPVLSLTINAKDCQ
ncbi:MAG: hypothetical protein HZB79_02640 [Deltaproteobacteria bacterium]|nr:hypothetical protein [Deltaproteobacteria bacterium]